jgi:hypothetical protein
MQYVHEIQWENISKIISRRCSQIENADGRRKRNLRKSARNKSALICERKRSEN